MDAHELPSFRALIDNSSDVISLASAAGEVLYASASSAKVFGYFPEELVGRSTFDLIHPEDRDYSRRALRDVLAKTANPLQIEMRIHRKDGSWCWVESTLSNFLEEPLIGAIVVNCREIGTRRAAREQLRREIEELAHSNAELEHFAYAVAHDLKEPLRTVSMFTELLVKKTHLDSNGKELAEFIVDGVSRMSALLEGLHAFALRAFDDRPQPIDLGHVVAAALQNLGHALTASEAIVTVDPLPCVLGNEKPLVSVFQNLIVNAIKYRSETPIQIRVAADPRGLDWIIRVKDNGIGIAQEQQERVFRLLERLHGTEIPGAGIGLAICEKIIESLGGTIWVESEPGAGSTFCFTIAAANDGAVYAASAGDRHLSSTPAEVLEPSSTRASTQRTGNNRGSAAYLRARSGSYS